MSSNIIKYHNDLNLLALPKDLNTEEINIFFAIISEVMGHGIEEVVIPFSELKKITGYKQRLTKKQYINVVTKAYHKMIGLRFVYETEDVEGEVNLFQGYEKELKDDSFTISVTPKFYRMFNGLESQFTSFPLLEFCEINGIYAKNLYRLLKQWKRVGRVSYEISKFRDCMGVADSYETKELTRRVIKPAVEKLRNQIPEFADLTYKYEGSGRFKKVAFSWTPEKKIKKEKEVIDIDLKEENTEEHTIEPYYDFETGRYDYSEALKQEQERINKYKEEHPEEFEEEEFESVGFNFEDIMNLNSKK